MAAALLVGILLLLGLAGLVFALLQPVSGNPPILENWLIVIFKLHAEINGLDGELLGRNLLDIVILFLVGVLAFSLANVFQKAGRVWCYIASALSLIAIILYLVTREAGRSTVMLAVLILSVVMLRNQFVQRGISITGIIAAVFLFAGDLTVGIQSNFITILFSIGYMLILAWFFWMARRLLKLSYGT